MTTSNIFFYAQPNYQGPYSAHLALSPGQTYQLPNVTTNFKSMSIDPGMTIDIYSQPNYLGELQILTGNVPNYTGPAIRSYIAHGPSASVPQPLPTYGSLPNSNVTPQYTPINYGNQPQSVDVNGHPITSNGIITSGQLQTNRYDQTSNPNSWLWIIVIVIIILIILYFLTRNRY